MNERKIQTTETTESSKKDVLGLVARTGGALAIVAAATGAVLTGNSGDRQHVPEQSSVISLEPAVPAAQKIKPGTIFVARPNPRRQPSATEAPRAEKATSHVEVTTKHTQTRHHNIDKPLPPVLINNDVVVLVPPPESVPETTPPSPTETPTPNIVP